MVTRTSPTYNKPLSDPGTGPFPFMTDVLIVGGGAVGLSLAYELACRGKKVAIVERGDVGRESSWAGAGIVPPPGTTPATSPLAAPAAKAVELHAEWHRKLLQETGIDNGYRVCGATYLADTPEQARELEAEVALWRNQGVDHRPLTAADLATVEPALAGALDDGRLLAAYRLPGEAQVRNPWHIRALESACTARGVRVLVRAPVEKFVLQGDRIVEVCTAVGSFAAESFCLCGGAWSGALGEQLGLRLGVKPIRGQIVLLRPPQPIVRGIVYTGRQFRHYFVARDDGRILVGSTEEDVGFDKQPTAGAARELLDFALRLVPDLASAPVEQTWAGLRPFSADGLPYLGRVPHLTNAYVAAGHYRWGLALSPITAVAMTRLLCGEAPGVDLAPFRLDR